MDFLLRQLIYLMMPIFILTVIPTKILAQDSTNGLKEELAAQASAIAALEKRLSDLEHSEIVCLAGKKVSGAINKWSPVSSCPETYTAMGIERLDLEGNHDLPNIHVNDLWCDQKGCRAWCIGATCSVISKCCKWQPKSSIEKK
jgi:hypothetical protein